MKFTLKKDYKVNDHKTLPAGTVMDVTEELYQWLEENGYGEEEKKKEKKAKKTKKEASDKEHEIEL